MKRPAYRKLSVVEMNRMDLDSYRNSEKIPIVVLLDNVRSMHNVGAVFRTVDAFRLEKVLLCGITGVPPHPLIRKTALGAEESVEWEYYKEAKDTIAYWRNKGYVVVSLEQTTNSYSLEEIPLDGSQGILFIIGNEVHGVSDELIKASDYCLEIPQYGTKHSLNVSVATGIALFELQKLYR